MIANAPVVKPEPPMSLWIASGWMEDAHAFFDTLHVDGAHNRRIVVNLPLPKNWEFYFAPNETFLHWTGGKDWCHGADRFLKCPWSGSIVDDMNYLLFKFWRYRGGA